MLSRSWMQAALGIAVSALFVLYALFHSDAVALVWTQAHTRYLALLILPAVGVLWAQGKVFQRSCREFDVRIGERESLSLAVLTTAGNYVGALRLGAVAKALYVKRARNLSITDTIAIVMGGTIVSVGTAIVCGLLLLLFLPIGRTPAGTIAVSILAGACLALLVIFLSPLPAIGAVVERHVPAFARARVAHLMHACGVVGRRRLVRALVLWQIGVYLLAAAGFYVGFVLVLDCEIGFTDALAFTILTSLASIAALTPGNLGLQEFLIVALAQSLQLGQGAGVVVAASLRVVQVVVIVVLSPLAWRTLRAELPPSAVVSTAPGRRQPPRARTGGTIRATEKSN